MRDFEITIRFSEVDAKIQNSNGMWAGYHIFPEGSNQVTEAEYLNMIKATDFCRNWLLGLYAKEQRDNLAMSEKAKKEIETITGDKG